MKTTLSKTYSEALKFKTFKERFEYLKLDGKVGDPTFANYRRLNQIFYSSSLWSSIRDQVIIRDNGCDLGIEGYDILDPRQIRIHHIVPITVTDIVENNVAALTNMDNLITTTQRTHNAIHYGNLDEITVIERYPNDTAPWRR